VGDVPPDLERIVTGALVKDPSGRYQSAEDLREDLVRYGRGRPIVGAPAIAMAATGAVVADAATVAATPPAVDDHSQEIWHEEQRRWGPVFVTVLGLGLLLGVIIYALFFLGKGDGATAKKTIEVPSVVGQTYEVASVTLTDLGFKVSRVDEVSTEPVETVIAQRPDSGRLLEKGRTVTLTVSGSEVTIPELTGTTFEEASADLQQLGLVVERIDQESPDKPPGSVLSTNPPAGTAVAKGSGVQVTVASEPPVPVPSVVGQDQVQAQTTLQNAGFQVTVVPTPGNTVAAGKVISTNPEAGTLTPKGTTIQMAVSTGPQAVPVPNVINQAREAGTAALTQVGFNVVVNGCAAGQIIATQSPSGGEAPPGTTVTIGC
ncbi:MAG TPA: PASTA domain-containing protein, partial [Acidimicrobiia bacterium]|nr:PASTA domain-containing protein [Acidimicrobiia bacterium]